ncbi:DUF2383 domain-containing protein [Methylosarcina fibrata]|uniref:DUF2383 domain-containing protein n=1 Tax=Methylosarcina fibrata TaxID=105972 RepID=UPI00037648EB|nr:DUF2383 domain-containing protein [Methylosarcina fibrata]
MLRTEKQVALDTVINSSRKSIEHYHWVADAGHDERLKSCLHKRALHRETLVDKLAPRMYRLGDMPSSPDPEKVAVEEMVTQIKASFAEDGEEVLLTSLDEIDSQLLNEIGDALSLEFEAETMAMLRELQQSIIEARKERENPTG